VESVNDMYVGWLQRVNAAGVYHALALFSSTNSTVFHGRLKGSRFSHPEPAVSSSSKKANRS